MRRGLVLFLAAAGAVACEPRIPSSEADAGGSMDLDGTSGRDADSGAADAETGRDADGPEVGPDDRGVDVSTCWPTSEAEYGLEHADLRGRVSVTVEGTACARRYQLETTAPRRATSPNPRLVAEVPGAPILRTGHVLFDATYALALAEAREASVSRIRDGAFNEGLEVDCPSPGCFETGAEWPYVWSRDTGYALHLGLAFFDPPRGMSSLLFKVSDRRGGGAPELVQDTGTGGSWPVSSDRVVLALGARALRPYLQASDGAQFDARFFEALKNTVQRDRQSVFDPQDGLYKGEMSFLDWREQSYPAWAASDLAHIGMSKALSTNVAHLEALRLLAEMAREAEDVALATQAEAEASELSFAITQRFWLEAEGLLSSFIPTTLDPAPTRRFDLLGLCLAITAGVLTQAQAQTALSSYPTLTHGPAVLWPQQQFTPIYHNRAIWPFVTAYALRAARWADHAAFATHAMRSLFSAASLFLSNLENLELVSGLSYVDDGPYSGPVVGSERQLWSVGGYLGAVNGVLFGIEAEREGLRVEPYLPKALRAELFASSTTLQLSDFPFRGRRLSVRLELPPLSTRRDGTYRVVERRLNGAPLTDNFIPVDQMEEQNLLELRLEDAEEPVGPGLRLVADTSDYRQLFGPRTPSIESVSAAAGGVQIAWQTGGEAAADIELTLLRNGAVIASGIEGASSGHLDVSAGLDGRVPCYTLESRYRQSGNVSQRAKPVCHFAGPDSVRSILADEFNAVGGTLSNQHGRTHYGDWGDPGHQITSPPFVATQTGPHLIQIIGANGAGPRETGITAGSKRLSVIEVGSGTLIAEGQVFLPQTGSWADWREGSFVAATLQAQASYRVVLEDASWARNMSGLEHFALYTGGLGGRSGAFYRLNVSELRILSLVAP